VSGGLSEQQKDVWRTFFVMRRQLDLTLERRLQSEAGISGADYEILVALSEADDERLRTGQLADIIGWEKSRVSHQIARMEQRGLVSRRECGDDARGVWVTIEPDGRRAVLDSLRDRATALQEHFVDVLEREDLDTLHRISVRVLDSINPPICDETKAKTTA
jgi:DNA-binding MarR family transcriptional regulator